MGLVAALGSALDLGARRPRPRGARARSARRLPHLARPRRDPDGLLDALLAPPWQGQALLFAALATGAVATGRALTRARPDPDGAALTLNRRGHALVGRVFVLEAAIAGGHGRVRVADSSWRVAGPDSPAGGRVRGGRRRRDDARGRAGRGELRMAEG